MAGEFHSKLQMMPWDPAIKKELKAEAFSAFLQDLKARISGLPVGGCLCIPGGWNGQVLPLSRQYPCAAQACLLAVPARLDAAMAVRVLGSARHRTAPSASQSGASY